MLKKIGLVMLGLTIGLVITNWVALADASANMWPFGGDTTEHYQYMGQMHGEDFTNDMNEFMNSDKVQEALNDAPEGVQQMVASCHGNSQITD